MKLQAVKLLFPVTTPKFCGHFYGRKAQKQDKILIYIGKVVVGGTGLEPIPIVPYLVIKCYKVPYLYGYDGHMWSYLVINIYIVSHAFCGQIVGRTGNFVGSLLAGIYNS